ncbi:MAG: ACP S-malonyltransferase [Candidatus Margulisiibacteriota bacterium]|nr:ACP S-malonyltransferase [Candidatus Margulisiibacteriota bacterium]
MAKTAFVFPGQGSQTIGMGKGYADGLLEKASEVLGFDLLKLCMEGPEEELKRTEITQPAILTVSVAAYRQLTVGSRQLTVDVMAGHSLGEYSALVAAGSISFEDAVKTVHLRGKYMQEAVPVGKGAMAAVIGGDREKIIEILSDEAGVEAANFNSPGQIVISGIKEAVDNIAEPLKAAGAKKIIPLPVSAPFHCFLMKPAQEKLALELGRIKIDNAKIPVVANVNAEIETDAGAIKQNLIDQVSGSVKWEDSILKMISLGVTSFVEVGPGKVLCGLIKKINKDVEVKSWEELS